MSNKENENEGPYRSSIVLIREVLNPEISEKKEFLWQDITIAIGHLIQDESREVETLLVDLLEMDYHLRLAPDSDIPGRMPPTELLKAIAIEKLVEWTGRKYMRLFEQVRESPKFPAVSRVAKTYINKLQNQ